MRNRLIFLVLLAGCDNSMAPSFLDLGTDLGHSADLVALCDGPCSPGHACERDAGGVECSIPPTRPPTPVPANATDPSAFCKPVVMMAGACCQRYLLHTIKNGAAFTESWTDCGAGWECDGEYDDHPGLFFAC